MKQIKDETVAALIDVLKSIDMTNEIPRKAQAQIKNYIAELENAVPVPDVTRKDELIAILTEDRKELARLVADLTFDAEPESADQDFTELPGYGYCYECKHFGGSVSRWDSPECEPCMHTLQGGEDNWRPKEQS